MISCQLNRVTRSPTGLQACSSVRIAAEVIEVGRGSACHIHLPDHRVDLLHARIRRGEDGILRLEATADAIVSVNGYVDTAAVLTPGTQIGIGPYRITVGAVGGDGDLDLTLEAAERNAATKCAVGTGIQGLGDLLASKRRLAIALAAAILVVALTLTMATRLSPSFEAWQARLPFAPSGLLNPAPLSPAHATFGNKCSSCHRQAFVGVADAACRECHRGMGTHVAASDARTNEFAQVRCAECHAAHAGKAAADGRGQCVACHRRQGKELAKVRDFADDHPEFRLTVAAGDKPLRVRRDEPNPPAERPGLKFSHKVHLAKEGVSSPDGNTVLVCRNCHQPAVGGDGFAPMDMAKTCQQSRCHRLRFDEPMHGLVPHGSVREAVGRVRDFYLERLAEAPAEYAKACAAAGKGGGAVKRAVDCADALTRDYAATFLFHSTGDKLKCVLCHEVSGGGEQEPWRVAPVQRRHDWMPAAAFSHRKHDTAACADCHDKAESKASGDYSMPSIAKCRECHAGSQPAAGKVRGDCRDCHRFHRVAAPVAADATPKPK